jgi:hypothetical protein
VKEICMKGARMSTALILLAMSVVAVNGGDGQFWNNKPYTEWSEKEVDKLLKNSPWSKIVNLSIGMGLRGRGGSGGDVEGSFPRTGGEGGGSENPAMEGAGGRSGGGRAGGLGDFGDGATSSVVITWYSRPVREAMARRIQLRNPETTSEQLERILNHDSSTFDLLVLGWSARASREGSAVVLQRMKEETFLLKKNKEKIALASLIPPSGANQPLVFRFPRESEGKPALTLEDKEVELVTKLGGSTIRTRFKLADMVIGGKLEL